MLILLLFATRLLAELMITLVLLSDPAMAALARLLHNSDRQASISSLLLMQYLHLLKSLYFIIQRLNLLHKVESGCWPAVYVDPLQVLG